MGDRANNDEKEAALEGYTPRNNNNNVCRLWRDTTSIRYVALRYNNAGLKRSRGDWRALINCQLQFVEQTVEPRRILILGMHNRII